MNYLKQLNAFWQFVRGEPLSSEAQLLYLYLLNCNNMCGWIDFFKIKTANIVADTGIKPRDFSRAREELVECGLVKYYADKSYSMPILEGGWTELSTQSGGISAGFRRDFGGISAKTPPNFAENTPNVEIPPHPPYKNNKVVSKEIDTEVNNNYYTHARTHEGGHCFSEELKEQVNYDFIRTLPGVQPYLDLFIKNYAEGCCEKEHLTFHGKKYTGKDFYTLIPAIDRDIVIHTINFLKKGGIENQYYYILSVVTDKVSKISQVEKARANGIARIRGSPLPFPEMEKKIKEATVAFTQKSQSIDFNQ